MAIALALLSSLLYGAGDFFGGLSARRLPPLVIGLASHVAVIAPMVLLAFFVTATNVRPVDLAWGVAAAVAGGLGVVLLYRGLAIGPMSIVSPLTAVVAASVPVLFGLARGERPSMLQWLGIGAALIAIVFMTRVSDAGGSTTSVAASTVFISMVAGLGFGFYFVALERTSPDSGLWPIAAGRVASSCMFAVVVALNPRARSALAKLHGGVLPLVLAAAAGDVGANTLYLLAVRRGDLSIVAVLSSLYPASTVLLAGRFLHERMNSTQRVGLGIAAVAIALVAGG